MYVKENKEQKKKKGAVISFNANITRLRVYASRTVWLYFELKANVSMLTC